MKLLIQLASQVLLCAMPMAVRADTPQLPMRCPGCNLRGIDFSSKTMGDKRFIDSDFSNADLRDANLSNMYMLTTNFEEADLRNSDLSHTFFTRSSNFRNADLRGAILYDVWFTQADLRGADLRGTYVGFIHTLEDADLRGAKVDEIFYREVMKDQPYGICMDNTILPNGTIVRNSCRFK